jgi:hypothetical protein
MKRKQFTYVQTQVCKNANTTKDWIFSESKFRKSMSSTCLYKHILAKYQSLCELDAPFHTWHTSLVQTVTSDVTAQ